MPKGLQRWPPQSYFALPGDDELPRELGPEQRPNRSYMGHTSELIPTPWPWEGRDLLPGVPRRFPLQREQSKEIYKERQRLAAIENPGLCQARRRRRDAWCKQKRATGLTVCTWHGGKLFPSMVEKSKRAKKERELMNKAEQIITSVKK